MKLPPSGTKRHQAMMALHKHGEMMLSEICKCMPKEGREPVRGAVEALVSLELATRTGFIYDLTKSVRDYLDGCEPVKDDYVPQIATPRTANVWTPEMKGYEAMLCRARR